MSLLWLPRSPFMILIWHPRIQYGHLCVLSTPIQSLCSSSSFRYEKKILKLSWCFLFTVTLSLSKLTSNPLSTCHLGRGEKFCEGNKGFFSSIVWLLRNIFTTADILPELVQHGMLFIYSSFEMTCSSNILCKFPTNV